MGIRRIPIKGGGGWGPYFPQPGSGSFPKPQQPNPLSVFLSTFGNAMMMPVLQQNYLGDMEDRRWRERQQLEQDWRTQQEEREYQRRLEMERQKHEWDVEADAAKAEAARMPLQNFSGAIPGMQEAIGGGLDPDTVYRSAAGGIAEAPQGQKDAFTIAANPLVAPLNESFRQQAVGGVLQNAVAGPLGGYNPNYVDPNNWDLKTDTTAGNAAQRIFDEYAAAGI